MPAPTEGTIHEKQRTASAARLSGLATALILKSFVIHFSRVTVFSRELLMNTTQEQSGALSRSVGKPAAGRRRRSEFSREKLLAIAIVSPSIIAIAIFVYGFI